jgi:hypothetical protein
MGNPVSQRRDFKLSGGRRYYLKYILQMAKPMTRTRISQEKGLAKFMVLPNPYNFGTKTFASSLLK